MKRNPSNMHYLECIEESEVDGNASVDNFDMCKPRRHESIASQIISCRSERIMHKTKATQTEKEIFAITSSSVRKF